MIHAQVADGGVYSPNLHRKFMGMIGVDEDACDRIDRSALLTLLQPIPKLLRKIHFGASLIAKPGADRPYMKKGFLTVIHRRHSQPAAYLGGACYDTRMQIREIVSFLINCIGDLLMALHCTAETKDPSQRSSDLRGLVEGDMENFGDEWFERQENFTCVAYHI